MTAPGASFRPARPCPWCGSATTRSAGTCTNCIGVELNLRRPVTDDCALPPGRWVLNRRGVQQFIPDPNVILTRPRCGTDSGYYAHRTRKERTCSACRYAHAEAARVTAARRVAS